MRNSTRHRTTSLLLSALVLACGIVPPGIEHAHAGGGDATHGHENGEHLVVEHPHDHDSDGQHGGSEIAPTALLLADVVRHLHWQLFGMEVSLPTGGESGKPGDEERPVPPTILRVVIESVPAIHADPSSATQLLRAECAPGVGLVLSLRPAPQPENLIGSAPLCDRARHERSGVQLA